MLSYKFKFDRAVGERTKCNFMYTSLIVLGYCIFEGAFDCIWKSNGTIPSIYKVNKI